MRISKKQLAIVFGFYSPGSARARTERLREEVFTDVVLEELGISEEFYKSRRIFPARESKAIMDYFNIEKDDLRKNVYGFHQGPRKGENPGT